MDKTTNKDCPFKKRIKISYSIKNGEKVLQDRFAWCDKERCIAYRDGHCLRLESQSNGGK